MACYHVFMAVSILGLFAIGVYEAYELRREIKETEEYESGIKEDKDD